MPTQPPHHVSSQEFQNPDSAFMRYVQICETNPIPQGQQPKNTKRTQFPPRPPTHHPKNAKRTQSHKAHNPISQNEPNLLPGKYAKRTQFPPGPRSKMRNEPNPSMAHSQKMRNEPNLPTRSPCPTPNNRNEPNYRRGGLRTED